MNNNSISGLLSTTSALIALCLSAWLFFGSAANNRLQVELQRRQDDIQARQQALQTQQQQYQAQQQQIEAGAQLAQQVGPAVLRDLASLQIQNKNAKIAALLKKFGIEAKENPAQP